MAYLTQPRLAALPDLHLHLLLDKLDVFKVHHDVVLHIFYAAVGMENETLNVIAKSLCARRYLRTRLRLSNL